MCKHFRQLLAAGRLGGLALPALLCAGATAAAPAAPPARVAVLVEPGLPPYGGTPAVPPHRMVQTLAGHGIQAVALTAAQAADPATLSAARFSVLVLPYGNAFPKPALTNLRAFHAAGGCLVMAGVPFCHPCDKTDGKWQDLGHAVAFGHEPAGMGTGGFIGPFAAATALRAAAGNPLGVTAALLAGARGRPQCLDTATLAPEDEVLPLVQVPDAAGKLQPAAALIRHKCALFPGARDVWIGQIASQADEQGRYLAEQLFCRGVLWCLREKGELPASEFRTRLAALGRIPRPGPLPGNLAYKETPRPWGDTYLPRGAAPARRLLFVDVTALKPEEKVALTCLQGLVSRKQPRLWLNRGDQDRFWLDWHKELGHIGGYDEVRDWPALFKQFAGAYRGAVVPDPGLYRGDLLAANVASCEDLIVAPPELARRLGIPVKLDLRGRFPTYVEGMRWVWQTYKGRLNHYLCNYLHPARLQNCAFDYDIAWRGVMLWAVGPVDDHQPGADIVAERRLLADIFAEMAPNVAILGFPYAGEGVGLQEGPGVALASRYAKGLVCSDFMGNVTVTSGVRVDRLEQPKQPPAPALDKSKIYIALVMSDGDNENTWDGYFKRYFDDPAFGKFPLAFGMGPAIRELQPAIAEWYYRHATPTTEFISDVSGVAYTQPEEYGRAYADRQRVVDGFLRWTAREMQAMGMRSIRTVGGDDAAVSVYATHLPFCHSIFADMGRYSGREGIENLTYSLADGMPVFRAVTSWRYGKEGFLREVREQVGTHRPAFVNGFVHCWTFHMPELARIYEQRDPDMVFVTPAQLAALYRESKR